MSGISFATCLIGALSMGMTCGAGCSPAISLFLTSYVMKEEGKDTKGIWFKFFMGKALAIILVCLTASLVGKVIVNEGGYLGKYAIDFVLPIFITLSGMYMMWDLYKKSKGQSCNHCKGCVQTTGKQIAPLLGGFLYGLTPCAPMIWLVGYALSMSFLKVMILALVFSLASSCSPLIFLLIFSKLLTRHMKQDVPKLYHRLQFAMFGSLIVMGGVMLI